MYFNEEMKEALSQTLPAIPDYLKSDASLEVVERATQQNAELIAELERQQAEVRAGNRAYNGIEVANRLQSARQERAVLSGKLLVARGRAEDATKAELRQAQAAKLASDNEARIKAQYRAAWQGTEASFEQAWPSLLQQHLSKDAVSNLDRVKASMRARFGAY